jgi:hypothetical protein
MGERVRGEFTKREVKLVRLDVTAIAFFASCFVLLFSNLGVPVFSLLVDVSLKFLAFLFGFSCSLLVYSCCLGFCLFVGWHSRDVIK